MINRHSLLNQVPKSFSKQHFVLHCDDCDSKSYVLFDPVFVSGSRYPYICPFCGSECSEVYDLSEAVNEYAFEQK